MQIDNYEMLGFGFLLGVPKLAHVQVRGPRDANGPKTVQLRNLPTLRDVYLGGGGPCQFILNQLPALERLAIGTRGQEATKLSCISFESRLEALRELHIRAPALDTPETKPDLPQLKVLNLNGCTSIRSLIWIANMDRLQAIHAQGCDSLEDVQNILPLPELTHLNLQGCESLRPVPKPATMQNRDEIVDYKTRLVRRKTISGTKQKTPNRKDLIDGRLKGSMLHSQGWGDTKASTTQTSNKFRWLGITRSLTQR